MRSGGGILSGFFRRNAEDAHGLPRSLGRHGHPGRKACLLPEVEGSNPGKARRLFVPSGEIGAIHELVFQEELKRAKESSFQGSNRFLFTLEPLNKDLPEDEEVKKWIAEAGIEKDNY